MTLGEIRAFTKDMPDDTVVCGSGHCGDELVIDGIRFGTAIRTSRAGIHKTYTKIEAVILDMEDPGPYPD